MSVVASFSRTFSRFSGPIKNPQLIGQKVLAVSLALHHDRRLVRGRQLLQNFFQLLWSHKSLSSGPSSFSALLQLGHGKNALSSYKKQMRRIRKLIPDVTTKIAITAGDESSDQLSVEEKRLIQTLKDLVPSAALSYQQAIRDLKDKDRLSFRGPAVELREALRETLDHLASDSDVMAAPNWRPEGDRKTPTTKQKVRFILSARGVGRSGREVPEDTANTVDELIAGLTRSVQNMSSIATHVATERTNVRRAKRYIDALLLDILELN